MSEAVRHEAQRQMRDAGEIRLVLEVLNIHKNNSTVVVSATNAIGALAQDDTNCELLLNEGAVEKIMEIMNLYPNNVDVMDACTNALFSLNREVSFERK
jgi:hypothetical protein